MSKPPPGYTRFRVTIRSDQSVRATTVEVDGRTEAEALERVRIACDQLDQAVQPRPVDRTFTVEPGEPRG